MHKISWTEHATSGAVGPELVWFGLFCLGLMLGCFIYALWPNTMQRFFLHLMIWWTRPARDRKRLAHYTKRLEAQYQRWYRGWREYVDSRRA